MTKPSNAPQHRSTSDRRVPRQRSAADDGTDPSGGTGKGHRRRARSRRRPLRVFALALGAVVVVGAGGAAYAWHRLNSNVQSSALFSGKTGNAGTEKPDAFGRTPINILVIGSDNRARAADCKLGGACGDASPGQRADVEMVVHIAADRSNATVISIPRDLETELPACTDTDNHTSVGVRKDKINAALNYGPGCSVAAVHQLTGIPIDHFMLIDFEGVVDMSKAVGGVDVCVDNNVYDPYSHLKLSKGTHKLEGTAALEFLRTRHGFGTGDDPGRTLAQHIFLTNMLNTLKSGGTLTNPSAVWKLADAATKALTVDDKLGSIPKLIGLADDLNKVPTNHITFTTMQSIEQPDGPVLIGPGAASLFRDVAEDRSVSGGGTASSASPSPSTSPSPPPSPSGTIVQVRNGTGITGRASTVVSALIDQGFSRFSSTANTVPTATTSLTYPASDEARARGVAKALGLPSSALKTGSGSGIVLDIGSDWTSGTHFPGSATASPSSGATTSDALDGAKVQHGNDTSNCAPVSTFSTVGETADGRVTTAQTKYGMSPIRAYEISPDVKNSAP